MTNQPNLTCAQHAEEIAGKFIGYTLRDPSIVCDNPAYALCITCKIGENNMLDIEFWMEKEILQFRVEDVLLVRTLDQLTIIKIEGDEYRTLNVRVEVVE